MNKNKIKKVPNYQKRKYNYYLNQLNRQIKRLPKRKKKCSFYRRKLNRLRENLLNCLKMFNKTRKYPLIKLKLR